MSRSFLKQLHIIAVVRYQVLARLREQTLLCRAGTLCQLLFAGGLPEIGCRAANIMDIALKVRIFRHKLCLFHDRLMASCLDDPALMEGQCTEAASSKAASVADQAEFDLRVWPALPPACLVDRMISSSYMEARRHHPSPPAISGFCRWILHHNVDLSIRLYEPSLPENGSVLLYWI